MWANYISSSCKFPIEYIRQKLCKLDGSRQSYCKNKQAYFFWPTPYVGLGLSEKFWFPEPVVNMCCLFVVFL